jgi:hypothetical protein
MMKWFYFDEWKKTITPVEITKATEHFVVLAPDPNSGWMRYRKEGRRVARDGRYFPSFAEAKESIINEFTRKLSYAKESLHRAQSALGQIESLKETD